MTSFGFFLITKWMHQIVLSQQKINVFDSFFGVFFYHFVHLELVLLWEYNSYLAETVSGHHTFNIFAPIPYLCQFHTILWANLASLWTNIQNLDLTPKYIIVIHWADERWRWKSYRGNRLVFEVDSRLKRCCLEQIMAGRRRKKKQPLTKNDRAERMSQQLWGHHWHEMMGDCFCVPWSILEDIAHPCSSVAQPLAVTFKVLILEHLC